VTGEPSRGRFITFEGGEGGGKSTQARRLAAHLSEQGVPVLLTREPGGSAGAEKIRGLLLDGQGFDPLAEAMLLFAARREHVVATIRPALDAGLWVISDRFADSTRAYQCHGLGMPGEAYRRLADLALEGLSPDLTLILDIAPDVGMARANARGVAADRYERLDAGFHARVRAGFLSIAAAEPARCALVDAAAAADDVAGAVRQAVAERLGVA
jgi:dTMP kinase